jgi:hypothetical protein
MSTMLIQILLHTPRWVFVLFFALLVLGVQQLFTRQVTLRRVGLLPLGMTALAVYGVASAFSSQPLTLLAWAACAAAVAALVMRVPLPQSVRYDAASRRFQLPGSAVPLALMMGVFFTKYAVGITLSQVPQLAQHAGFAFGLSAAYGVFSGLFIGRAARLWKLAAAATQSPLTYAA